MKKNCSKCEIEKPFDEFYKMAPHKTRGVCSLQQKSAYQPKCKQCFKDAIRHKRNTIPNYQRSVDLKYNFGISLEDYNKMLELQEFKCDICLRSCGEFSRNLAVDHNHVTGKIRGLLCGQCNTALGKVKEDKEILLRMINYIDKHKS